MDKIRGFQDLRQNDLAIVRRVRGVVSRSTVVVGEEVMIGFDPDRLEEMLAE